VFKDKRFGEYNTKISPEEKMIRRFTLERQVKESGKKKKKIQKTPKPQETFDFLGWECPF